MGSWSH